MKILIFDEIVSGHHLEYLHHLYEMGMRNPSYVFMFLLPYKFHDVKQKFEWPSVDNISFEFFDSNLINQQSSSIWAMSRASYKSCRLVKNYSLEYKADVIFTNNILSFFPFAPFLLPKRIKLDGIIYRIYLYDEDKRGRYYVLKEKIKYLSFKLFKIYHRLYILNDENSAAVFNVNYNTCKFVYLPDPFVPILSSLPYDFRKENGIGKDKILFAHFGGLSRRKGTLKIMESIAALDENERSKYVFAFAGRIYDNIRDDFYLKYEQLKGRVHIIIKDEFCDYEYLACLCEACNAILCPYLDTSLSSGMLGYSSQFGKPMIAPNEGMIGMLVNKYGLGVLMDDNSSESLIKAYSIIDKGSYNTPSTTYCDTNTKEAFQNVIINNFTV